MAFPGVVAREQRLDLTALGRPEDWEEPKDRAPRLHGADPVFRD